MRSRSSPTWSCAPPQSHGKAWDLVAPRAVLSSTQKSGQKGRPHWLRLYPALFLRGLSIPGTSLRTEAKPGLGQGSASNEGLHCQADPSPPGGCSIWYQESQLVPRNSGPWGD